VVAPGVSVKTADLTFNGVFPINTRFSSGTSFAAPHVAGAMTLLLSAFPELTVSELEAALIDTAVDLGDIGPDNNYGFGMIDVMAAYRSLVPCTDADSDEYYAEAVCGTEPDCDDSDDTIHPGASEVKHDGIDQDCNGYDLTIDILSAAYFASDNTLCITATSILGENADLIIEGSGPMGWSSESNRWEIAVLDVAVDPQQVVVQGIEGIETTTTTATSLCPGNLDGDGDVDKDDLLTFAATFGSVSGMPNYDAAADLDEDGDIDAGDLKIFISNFGSTGCPFCP
jgi:serine protease AprX